jgi:UDP-N-acetylglucosamine diphosphorylase / glucose-1-phosphate thymidylyltransferase / UDP-N-acetylgalactosamine diphosphorylase / glucosamine-1-phosphate N-acetyltransferase / galactosamine-1-phosphate N-acetyltransferase
MSRIVLYDDEQARKFEPFALTRPFASMRVGTRLMHERWEAAAALPVAGLLAADCLERFDEDGSPVVIADSLPAGTVICNSRFAPALEKGALDVGDEQLGRWMCEGKVVALRLSESLKEGALRGGRASLESLASAGEDTELRGWWLNEVWDVVALLPRLLVDDIGINASSSAATGSLLSGAPAHAAVIGSHTILIDPSAEIEPHVVLDASAGPIQVEAEARIQAFTRLVGPCYVGTGSTVLGDRVAVCSIGDLCKVRGEVSNTTFTGHSNKAHDGFVGHSHIGRWVNLGAGTVTSNLKNTYGKVSLWSPDGIRDTGQQFLGTLFGDHVRTGIGLKLTTGCVLGAGANLFDRMPPKAVAPFSWGTGPEYELYDLERFIGVAERAMARRNVRLSAGMRTVLKEAHARRWNA